MGSAAAFWVRLSGAITEVRVIHSDHCGPLLAATAEFAVHEFLHAPQVRLRRLEVEYLLVLLHERGQAFHSAGVAAIEQLLHEPQRGILLAVAARSMQCHHSGRTRLAG